MIRVYRAAHQVALGRSLAGVPAGTVLAEWEEWSFAPAEKRIGTTTAGRFASEQTPYPGPPLAVAAPPGSVRAGDRLVAPGNPAGWDAASVAHLALRGLRGFAVAGEGPP